MFEPFNPRLRFFFFFKVEISGDLRRNDLLENGHIRTTQHDSNHKHRSHLLPMPRVTVRLRRAENKRG